MNNTTRYIIIFYSIDINRKVEIRSEKELNRRMVEVKKQVIKYSEGFETDRIIITEELFFSNQN